MERKKTRLNESEMKVMQIIWNAGHPITGQQVLGQLIRVGNVFARQVLPAISRPVYRALRIMETLPEAELPQFLSYFSY